MPWTECDDQRVSALDPLGFDDVISELPRWNAEANLTEISKALVFMADKACLEKYSYEEILAVIRDIGMFAVSVRKHGVEPTEIEPRLDDLFLKASTLTDLIPRDTLLHYTVWNPSGSRLRRYTNHPQEVELIESIKKSLPAIREATRHLAALRDSWAEEECRFDLAARIACCLQRFVVGLHHAIRTVEPGTFITQFRPYFEPFLVGRKAYRGPGAVTMPLHIFDFLLWGSSEVDQRYIRFTLDYVPYNTSEFRQYFIKARNTPSLLDMIDDDLSHTGRHLVTPAFLSAIVICMKRLRAFRDSHLRYAALAYHGKFQHSFSSGSGGHTTQDLDWLAKLTAAHELRIEKLKMVLPLYHGKEPGDKQIFSETLQGGCK